MLRRFSVDEYHRLIQADVLTEDDDVELIEGWVVCKVARNPPHDVVLGLVADALAARHGSGWHLRDQSAITTRDSEPEPGLALVRGARRDYLSRHPSPSDVSLIVEIAESSLDYDRDEKLKLYARSGIAVYWLVNLVAGHVEVYTSPSGDSAAPTYRHRQDIVRGQSIPLAIPGQQIQLVPVIELLP